MRFYLIQLKLILALLWLVPQPASAQAVLKFTLSENLPQFEQLADILRHAYSELGIQIEFQRMSRSRSLVTAGKGLVDGELAGTPSIEKKFPTLIRVSVPLMQVKVGTIICTRHSDETILDKIHEKKVGYIRGAVVFENYTKTFDEVWVADTYDELFGMLKLGRLDVVLGGQIALDKYGLTHEAGCLEMAGKPIRTVKLYHYLHERNAQLVPAITSILESMAASGEM